MTANVCVHAGFSLTMNDSLLFFSVKSAKRRMSDDWSMFYQIHTTAASCCPPTPGFQHNYFFSLVLKRLYQLLRTSWHVALTSSFFKNLMIASIFHTECEWNPPQLTPPQSSHAWQPFLPVTLQKTPSLLIFLFKNISFSGWCDKKKEEYIFFPWNNMIWTWTIGNNNKQ